MPIETLKNFKKINMASMKTSLSTLLIKMKVPIMSMILTKTISCFIFLAPYALDKSALRYITQPFGMLLHKGILFTF